MGNIWGNPAIAQPQEVQQCPIFSGRLYPPQDEIAPALLEGPGHQLGDAPRPQDSCLGLEEGVGNALGRDLGKAPR